MTRPRRFSLSQQNDGPQQIDLDNTDLPGYLTRRLREVKDLIQRVRPDAAIEITEGFLSSQLGFYVVATIDVDDIDDFDPIYEASWELLEAIHEEDDLPIYMYLLPKDREKAWADKSSASVAS